MIESKEIYSDFGDIFKHEARLKLWLPALKHLQAKLQRNLRYFTLPGPHAYDVVLWEKKNLLKYDGRGYPDVRFCEIDLNDFINAKRVLGNTAGVQAKFETIINSNSNSTEFKAFWDLFPYDVYNLDFCGTWFNEKEPVSLTFDAIIKLINLHIGRKDSKQFLLLLTIRIDNSRMNSQVISDLKDNINANLNNEELAPTIRSLVNEDIDNFCRKDFEKFVLVSIPKLISFKLISFSRRNSARIIELRRAVYPRKGYKIGKFVFLVDKGQPNYMVCPPWYKECVKNSFKTTDIIYIRGKYITNSTRDDLNSLKSIVKKREG